MKTISARAAIVRSCVTLAVLTLPLVAPDATPAVLAAAAAYIAYRGFKATAVYGMLALLLAIEVIYGFDIGTLSIAFLVAAGSLGAIQRFTTISFWSDREGWKLQDGVVTVVMAMFLYAVGILSGVVVGRVLYGYPSSIVRLSGIFTRTDLIAAAVTILIVVLVLRRTEVPFRRPIQFGI